MEGGPESLRGPLSLRNFVESFRESGLEVGFKVSLPLRPGEFSGERDGKETRDLAELGVTNDCFRDLERTVPGRWDCEWLETVEDLRSERTSRSLSIAKHQ